MFIIITGNPVDGFNHIGLFDSHDEAVDYAEKKFRSFDTPWWVVPLEHKGEI